MNIKAVIDTNVFVSAFWNGNKATPPVRIYDALLTHKFIPLFCDEIIAEYNEVLRRKKFGYPEWKVDKLIAFIHEFGERISPADPGDTIFPDPDDKVFYCAALAAQSDSARLVTGNARHYPAAPFVISPAGFASLLGI